ncbi:MAG: polyamine aminopropyltransferase [Comamonas sp.]
MQGLHLTADLYDCTCPHALMLDDAAIAALCGAHTQASGLTKVDERWVKFPDYLGQPGGVTGTILLAESHLAIHTWPETGNVTIDVYVCNFSGDNTGKAQALMDGVVAAYAPRHAVRQQLWRGDISSEGTADGGRNGLVTEALAPDAHFGLQAELLERRQTAYQTLELLQTPRFGKVLRLDGRFMTSEREEFFYHEALIHPATLAHRQPRKALIIGGGDGGAAEELLKHRTMERVVLAELDGEVVAVAQAELQAVHRGVWNDPRLQLLQGDGMAFLDQTEERFDLVFMDLTDPDTPAEGLYTAAAWQRMRRAMAPGGALVLHLGSPVFHPEQVRDLVAELQQQFAVVRCYGLYVPLYGSYWGMAVVSDSLDASMLTAAEAAQRLQARGVGDLQYYNPEVHGALFALPTYYRQLIAPGATPSPMVRQAMSALPA